MNVVGPETPSNSEEIDLLELFRTLWANLRVIAVSTAGVLAIASAYAFIIAKPTFESSALLLPTQNNSATADLGAAAALLGGKKNGSADVDLYQSLLTSRTVIHKLLKASIRNQSDSGGGKFQPLFQILGLDTSNAKDVDAAVNSLAKSVTVGSKESGAGGILEITFAANSPWLAQSIGNILLDIGQEELRLVRIKRSEVILSRLGVAVSQAHGEWDSTARALASYKDRNRSIALPQQMLELARLEMEKSSKEQKYLLARREYESQMLERAKAAPPMMILDPANLPAHKSKPKRLFILLLGMIVGFSGSCMIVLLHNFLKRPTP